MKMHTSPNAPCRFIVLAISALLVQACGRGGRAPDASSEDQALSNQFEIRTLSNRADLISDGDALVEVRVPRNVPLHKVTLTLNGVDVGASFVADQEARTLRGVLTGLRVGDNSFVA